MHILRSMPFKRYARYIIYFFCTGQVLSHGSRFLLTSQPPARTSQRLLLLNSIVEQLRIITLETIHHTPDWTNHHTYTISVLRSCRPCVWSMLLNLSPSFHKSKTFTKQYNQSMSAPNHADLCEYACKRCSMHMHVLHSAATPRLMFNFQ